MKEKNVFTDKKFIVIVAALCCLLWGSAYPAVKSGYRLFNISGGDIPSEIVFAGLRFSLAGIILLVIAQKAGKKIFKLSRKNIGELLLLGIIQTTLQYIFFYVGLANTTGVKGSIMNSTATFFSIFLAHFIYKNDKLNVQKIVGCAAGFAGVMVANFNSSMLDFSFKFQGEGFIILSAFVFSVGAIYAKKLTRSIDVMVVTGYSLFSGGAILILLGIINRGSVTHFTASSSLLLIYLALLSSIAFSLWNLLLKHNKVGTISVFSFLTPIFGVMLSAIFLGENIFDIKNFAALILVCLGIWLSNRERQKAN